MARIASLTWQLASVSSGQTISSTFSIAALPTPSCGQGRSCAPTLQATQASAWTGTAASGAERA
eukprot:6134710-Pyramimonas_sp.AAC.1